MSETDNHVLTAPEFRPYDTLPGLGLDLVWQDCRGWRSVDRLPHVHKEHFGIKTEAEARKATVCDAQDIVGCAWSRRSLPGPKSNAKGHFPVRHNLIQTVDLPPEQLEASTRMLAHSEGPTSHIPYFLQGYAGTGKTFTLTRVANANPFRALLAPTGKAAPVLRRKTKLQAQTIHSWLYRLKEASKDSRGRKQLEWAEIHDADSLKSQVVLIDEAAMVGRDLMRDILATGVIAICVGDLGQLKPVGQPPYFTTPDFELREIHRQAAGSPIIRQAHSVRQTGHYEADTKQFRIVRQACDGDVLNAGVMLTWTNRRRLALNAQARALRGIWGPAPQPGEPLMCKRNHSPSGVYRGGIYTLLAPFRTGDTSIMVDVDGIPRSIGAGRKVLDVLASQGLIVHQRYVGDPLFEFLRHCRHEQQGQRNRCLQPFHDISPEPHQPTPAFPGWHRMAHPA